MSGGKDIKNKIKSINNTQKITKAMQMVAASKMGKAQSRMRDSRPYAQKIKEVLVHLSTANPEYRHPFLFSGKSKTKGLVIISSDRGLCGGLNNNLFRRLIKFSDEINYDLRKYKVAIIGSKAAGFCRRMGMDISAQVDHLGDNPSSDAIFGIAKIISEIFIKEGLEEVHIASNQFTNTVTQTPWIRNLLPVGMIVSEYEKKEIESPQPKLPTLPWDYLYEPEAKDILDKLMPMYVRFIIFQALQENISCEMAARMIAMKNATDNSKELISDLQLKYNKVRQANITQEISEIVAGASAV